MKQQFVYVLKLVPRLIDENNWTEPDNQIIGRHFAYLQGKLKDGALVLAGRTMNSDPMGLVILETESEADARHIMENDPAVAEGIMTAQLYPYYIALMRGAA